MKKFLFLGIAATAMLASCTNDEVVEMNPQMAIGFESFVDKSTRAADDILASETFVFDVYGWRTKADVDEAIFANFANRGTENDVTYNNKVCTYSPLQYWLPGYTYNFEAVYPLHATKGVTFAEAKSGGKISFVSDSETDLLYAKASEYTALKELTSISSQPAAVNLTFDHMLSRVKFSFQNIFPENSAAVITVTNVQITNANTEGEVTPANSKIWTSNTPAVVTFASPNVTNMAGQAVEQETEHKYLIPAAVGTYKLTFTVTLTQGNVSDTFNHEVTLPTLTLEAGKSYDFYAALDATNVNPETQMFPIEFTANVTDWVEFTDGGEISPAASTTGTSGN